MPHEIDHEFLNRLKVSITASGKNKEQVAYEMEIGLATLYRWLTGKTTPDYLQLVKFSQVCKVRIEWLSSGNGEYNAP